jgi:hypothetical protein
VPEGLSTFSTVCVFGKHSNLERATTGFRFEDRLDIASKFIPWKVKVTLVVMENELWEFSNTIMTPSTNPKDMATHELKDVKARRIILDAIKDHLIPHISNSKKLAKDMFVSLANLFQSNNTNMKMVSREKLRDTKMTKSDTMTNYLTNITQVCD